MSNDTNKITPPPIGVIPQYIWYKQRICDISRAIHDFSNASRLDHIERWSLGLTETIKEYKRILERRKIDQKPSVITDEYHAKKSDI